MWWRTRHGRVLQRATTCSNSSRDRPNTPAASLLLLHIPLAPLLSHVLVPTPTSVAGRSPSNNQVRHKTPGHTRGRPHSRGAAPNPARPTSPPPPSTARQRHQNRSQNGLRSTSRPTRNSEDRQDSSLPGCLQRVKGSSRTTANPQVGSTLLT